MAAVLLVFLFGSLLTLTEKKDDSEPSGVTYQFEEIPAPAPAPEVTPAPAPESALAPALAPEATTAPAKPPKVKAPAPAPAPISPKQEQEHFDRIRRTHPDFEKYRDSGSLIAWIQRQPSYLRDPLLKTYKEGDSDSVINLLTQFKKDNNNPLLETPAPVPASEAGRDGRFIDNNNGTVTDTGAGLMWTAKDNGSDIDWQNAKIYCESYRGGGYTDWRMPTQGELAGLYETSKFQKVKCGSSPNHIATDLIHLTCWWVWASGMRRGSDREWVSEAAYFGFDYGNRSWNLWSGTSYRRALPVRFVK